MIDARQFAGPIRSALQKLEQAAQLRPGDPDIELMVQLLRDELEELEGMMEATPKAAEPQKDK